MPQYEYHSAANIFPLMTESSLNELAADIAEEGLLEPVELVDGQIIDGRNRELACAIAEIDPDYIDLTGVITDPVAYVVSKNLKRRHLNESQRAMVAAKIRSETDVLIKDVSADLNVSPRLTTMANKVVDEGVDELQEAVEAGDASISAASKVAELSAEDQETIVEAGKKSGDMKGTIADAAKDPNAILDREDEKDDDESEEFGDDWTVSEISRRRQMEAGQTVILNKSKDQRLLAWAISQELYVDIGHKSKWGNPFILNEDGDRATVAISHDIYLGMKPSLQREINTLRGKALGCFCYPEICHGQNYLTLLHGADVETNG